MAAKGGRIDFMFLGPPLPSRWIRYCLHLIVKLPQGIKSLLPSRAFLSVRHYIWNRWLITQLLLHFGQRGYNLRRQIASFHRLSTPRSTVHRRKGSPKSRNYSPLVTIVQFLQTFNALPWKCFCSFWLIWFYKARACAFMMYVVVVVIVIVCGLTTCWRSQWRVKSVNCWKFHFRFPLDTLLVEQHSC